MRRALAVLRIVVVRLLQRTGLARVQGYACAPVDVGPGSHAVAVPVRNPEGRTIVGIALASITERLPDSRMANVVQSLQQQAAPTTARLAEQAQRGRCSGVSELRLFIDQTGFCNNIVITMKPINVAIRQIGNSRGVVIPKLLLAQLGLESEAEISIEGDALVLRKPAKPVRAGWAEAAQKIAEHSDDALVLGEFGNEGDADLKW